MTLTDAETDFADSAYGRMLIAKARRDYEVEQAYKGRDARPWTDAMETAAIRDAAKTEARSTVQQAVIDNAAPAATASAQVAHDATVTARKDRLRDAWRAPVTRR